MIDYTQLVGDHWRNSNKYYDEVETETARKVFWGEGTSFLRLFRKLDLDSVIELACGHGRHYEHYGEKAGRVRLFDINQENIDFCAARFAALSKKPELVRNNGRDFVGVPDGDCTAVFSYDSMVHFEFTDVMQYIRETFRVLKPGGRALFHHSNFTGAPGLQAYKSNQFGWRNYMSASLFAHISMRTQFHVAEQVVFGWAGVANLDCLTLLVKPLNAKKLVDSGGVSAD